MSMFKQIFAFLCIILVSLSTVQSQEEVSLSTVQSQEDKWIDGIRFQLGNYTLDPRIEKKNGEQLINRMDGELYNHTKEDMIPITIAFTETLMNSWSNRGPFMEFFNKQSIDESAPVDEYHGGYWRQNKGYRDYLIDEFFNDDDKNFISGKDKWALSLDGTISQITFGYNWGVFIPAFGNHRFFNIMGGFSISKVDASLKLNLCEVYKIIVIDENRSPPKKDGICVGKYEIDTASINKFYIHPSSKIILWQRITKNSLWKLATMGSIHTFEMGNKTFPSSSSLINFKKHPNKLYFNPELFYSEFISYTYRF